MIDRDSIDELFKLLYNNTLYNDLKKAAKFFDSIELNFETVKLKEIFHYIQPKAYLSNEKFVDENNQNLSFIKKRSSSNFNNTSANLNKWTNTAWDLIK